MSIAILLQGVIAFGDPQRRTSKNGNGFVILKVRVANGGESYVVTVFVFGETAGAEALRLHDGDSVAVQGSARFEIYSPDGSVPRVSVSITADSILALRQPPKERKPKADKAAAPPDTRQRPEPERIVGMRVHAGERDDALDDSIPF